MTDDPRSEAALRTDQDAADPADAPAIDGPFVEAAPGVWVRASDVGTVARAYPAQSREQTRSRVFVTGRCRPEREPTDVDSPYRVDVLLTALRLAEHREDARRLTLAMERAVRLFTEPVGRQ